MRVLSSPVVPRSGLVVGILGVLAALLLACGGTSAPQGSSAAPKPTSGPVLRVGTASNYAPVSFRRDGELLGIEPDFAHKVATALGRSLQVEEMAFPDLIPALEQGRIDVIMAGMSVTPERQQRVAFVEPYLQVGQMALIRERDVPRFGRISSLQNAGVRVGYESGTTGAAFCEENLPKTALTAFTSPELGVTALKTGQIDFFIHDAPTVWRYALRPTERQLIGLFEPLTEEYLAWAVRKDDTELKAQLDALVKGWKSESRLRRMLDRWIPIRIELR